MLATHRSKYGSSAFMKSPWMICVHEGEAGRVRPCLCLCAPIAHMHARTRRDACDTVPGHPLPTCRLRSYAVPCTRRCSSMTCSAGSARARVGRARHTCTCAPTLVPAYHARVQLNGHDLLGPLQQLHGQVARARANLEHHVRGLHARLVHDGLHHLRVLQDVLALALVELHACVGWGWQEAAAESARSRRRPRVRHAWPAAQLRDQAGPCQEAPAGSQA